MKLAILGATGKTGVHLVRQALAAGHEVRVLVRAPSKLTLAHERLTVLTGDAANEPDMKRLVEGVDAVVSALGPQKGQEDICSRATAALLAAGSRRYVVTSGAGIDVPGDEKDLPGRIISRLIRFLSPAIVGDKAKEFSLLQASPCEWTVVRPPRLVDTPATGKYRVDVKSGPGSKVSREDLAHFLLACATDKLHVRQAPFIAS
jgi:putative NADH-flavin reductase